MKAIKKLTIVLMIIGLVRVAFGVYEQTGKFLPTIEELHHAFLIMPDVPTQLSNDFMTISSAFDTFTGAFQTIDGLGSFFNAMGNFFTFLWRVIELVIDTILIPINFIIWAFQNLFGLGV